MRLNYIYNLRFRPRICAQSAEKHFPGIHEKKKI